MFQIKRERFRTIVSVGPFWIEFFQARPGFHAWTGRRQIGACAFEHGLNLGIFE